ncbi:MAG: PilN domain-containing protein [Rhodocyclaceae bacterium]|nr:PilN domain-containing protein [Rhodocyclaceae bacterium]
MIRINLLPHREQRRAERRKQFYALLGLMVLLGGLVAFVGHLFATAQIEAQEARNRFIESENSALDKQIAEIRRLREQIDALLSRKAVIENLQGHRNESVLLFNELASQMPESVYLTNVEQDADKVTISGYAQSNARVSTLMRNMDGSPHLKDPQLLQTKIMILVKNEEGHFDLVDPKDLRGNEVDPRRVTQYAMTVKIERPEPESGEEAK